MNPEDRALSRITAKVKETITPVYPHPAPSEAVLPFGTVELSNVFFVAYFGGQLPAMVTIEVRLFADSLEALVALSEALLGSFQPGDRIADVLGISDGAGSDRPGGQYRVRLIRLSVAAA